MKELEKLFEKKAQEEIAVIRVVALPPLFGIVAILLERFFVPMAGQKGVAEEIYLMYFYTLFIVGNGVFLFLFIKDRKIMPFMSKVATVFCAIVGNVMILFLSLIPAFF